MQPPWQLPHRVVCTKKISQPPTGFTACRRFFLPIAHSAFVGAGIYVNNHHSFSVFLLFPLYEIKNVLYNRTHRERKGLRLLRCVKCGRDIQDGAVFCPDCLEEGKRYPIKPGTAIHLPLRPAITEKHNPRRKREPSASEQIVLLRVRVRRLRNTVLLLCLCLCLAVALMVLFVLEPGLLSTFG